MAKACRVKQRTKNNKRKKIFNVKKKLVVNNVDMNVNMESNIVDMNINVTTSVADVNVNMEKPVDF